MPRSARQKSALFANSQVLCVVKEARLVQQIEAVALAKRLQLTLESKLERILDHFEEHFFDILVLSSDVAVGGSPECIELLEVLSAENPATQILFFIHPHEIELAVAALRAGSYHYAKLPVSDKELQLLIEAALERRPSMDQARLLKRGRRPKGFEDMVGVSPDMKHVYHLIRQAAVTDIPVLLSGETGTGKDLAAKAIHQLSKRSHRQYTPVHLGALPQELVASELFGHEKGAFTGASGTRKGSLERSHLGTVFLDEISTIDDRVQISLLRLLETKTFHRIGGSKTIKANVRIIAASNEDLGAAVQRGAFREDLYYRLEVFQITMPPLRKRDEDLPLLIDSFLAVYNHEYQKRISGLSRECVRCLTAYDWPGNVRELKNVIHRAVVICTGDVILPEHLPTRMQEESAAPPEILISVGTTLEAAEREVIRTTLQATANNRRQAARLLGISRGTMYNKLKKYRLEE